MSEAQKKVIGITGRAGAGKDTVARMICNALPEASVMSLAAPLKEFAEAIFLFPREWLYGGSELRSSVMTVGTGYWVETLARFWNLAGSFHREWLAACGRTVAGSNGGSAFVDWFDSIRRTCENDPSKLNPRHVLQQLGTEFGRKHIHQDVWFNVTWQRIRNSPGRVCVVPDVRFDNEAQPILNSGGQVWAVVRHVTGQADSHESERGIDPRFVTATFPNFGTFESLSQRVRDELYYMGLT